MATRRERVTFWRGESISSVPTAVAGRLMFEESTGNVYIDLTNASQDRKQLTDTTLLKRRSNPSDPQEGTLSLTFGDASSSITISGDGVTPVNADTAAASWQAWLNVVPRSEVESTYLTQSDAATLYLSRNELASSISTGSLLLESDGTLGATINTTGIAVPADSSGDFIAGFYKFANIYLVATDCTITVESSKRVGTVHANLSGLQNGDPFPSGRAWWCPGLEITVDTSTFSLSNIQQLRLSLTIQGVPTELVVAEDIVSAEISEHSVITWMCTTSSSAETHPFVLKQNIVSAHPMWGSIPTA